MDIASLEAAYDNRTLTPSGVVAAIYDEIASAGQQPVWISLLDRAGNMARARALRVRSGGALAAAVRNSVCGEGQLRCGGI